MNLTFEEMLAGLNGIGISTKTIMDVAYKATKKETNKEQEDK